MALDSTVVIQSIAPNGRGAIFIKGTVDSVEHKMRWDNRLFAPAELNAQKVAAEFHEHYLNRVAVEATVSEETVTVMIPGSDVPQAVVVFAESFAMDSYDDYAITATVGGTSTTVLMNAKLVHQKYRVSQAAFGSTWYIYFREWLARELYRQRVFNANAAHLLDTFTISN